MKAIFHKFGHFLTSCSRRLVILSLSIIAVCAVGFGYADWTYNVQVNTVNSVGLVIGTFTFGWTGSDLLDEDSYNYSYEFQDALNGLNDPTSEEGQALATAIAANSRRNWLGNNDTSTVVSSSLDKVLDVSDDCTYLITINSDGSYCLYITYDDLSKYCDSSGNIRSQYIYTGRSPAKVTTYKTLYTKDSSGKYVATQSWVGTCTLSYYDNNYTGQKQPGIYSGGFTSN